MIREAKTLLEGIIKEVSPGITIVKSVAEESKGIMARKFPLVSLITNPGKFDNSEARTIRYFEDNDPKRYRERYVRGHRKLPILIRCWEEGEDKADELVSNIIPELPSQWECNGFSSHVEIGVEEHSDHTGNLNKPYVSVIEVLFISIAARKPKDVPVIETVVSEGDDISPN